MQRRIDVHTHSIPPFWADELPTHGGVPPWGTPKWTPESCIAYMDALEVDVAVLSLSAPGVEGWSGAEQIDMLRRTNDYGADLVQKNARFGFFATLPFSSGVDETLAEIARAYDDLHADGVVILSNYRGKYLGDPSFEPIWKELNQRKSVVFVHPANTGITGLPGIPGPIVDFPMDTTRAAVSLLSAGHLERFTETKIILSHAGGALPYLADRVTNLLHTYVRKDRSQALLLEDLKQFYFDTAISTPSALPSLTAVAAPDHILFGSDDPYPSVEDLGTFSRQLDAYLGFEPGQLDALNRANSEALFPRLKKTA